MEAERALYRSNRVGNMMRIYTGKGAAEVREVDREDSLWSKSQQHWLKDWMSEVNKEPRIFYFRKLIG